MKNLFKIFTIAAGTLIFSGCATLVSKWNYPVSIESDPPGANFKITNRDGIIVAQGVTPQVVELPSGYGFFTKEHYFVDFSLASGGNAAFGDHFYFDGDDLSDGFLGVTAGTSTSVELVPRLDGWYWWNFALVYVGAVGLLVIDPWTGAMYKLPETCCAELIGGNVEN